MDQAWLLPVAFALFGLYVFSGFIEGFFVQFYGGLKMLFMSDPFSHEHAAEQAASEQERSEELAGIMTLTAACKAYTAIEQLVGLDARAKAEEAKAELRKAALHAHDHCSPDGAEILRIALSATAL